MAAFLDGAAPCKVCCMGHRVRRRGSSPIDLRHAAVVALLGIASVAAQAQAGTPTPDTLKFHDWDVISIKPNKSGSGNTSIDSDKTAYRGENVSVKGMLSTGYNVRDSLITGLPPWAGSARYDINAKLVDPDPALKDRKQSQEEGEEEYRAQTRAILTDRFQLKTHTDTKVQPIYDLVLAKDGSKLKKSEASEKNLGSMSVHNTNMKATGISMRSLAKSLENTAGRTVVDKTGLPDDYDFELKWTREDQAVAANASGATDVPPDIFTALQEQLGLKLVADKGPVTTLVVDSIEPPTED